MLKNKRILITAGPTWVPIDSVRVISNIATGETGRLLAERLQKAGAKVTLIIGHTGCSSSNRNIRIINFKFFDDLRKILKKELRLTKYDFIIHSAAVSDFKPRRTIKNKIDSARPRTLKLIGLPKIIKDIRSLNPEGKLVMFKLESGVNDTTLIKRARKSLLAYQADFVVANRVFRAYKAFVLNHSKVYSKAGSKKELVRKLVEVLKRAR
ncbi:MAG: phosphopantothenoylcysteine decarboxylase [Candidatus Omnitrophica bacterium]|nr:phosphopantothenoylcysteine decarboxylase [Candidatus Omnitrophota bacterium]